MKSRYHEVSVKIRFDREVTVRQAMYAAWNHLQGEIYGTDDPDHPDEPWGEAKVTARKPR
ncbi:hypothetical protein [Oceaniradius stylonematis]|uniref:hypothetical protein n=1 Tax=Oceaniradius stylonematis TaxID=2184161 RepID=UPI00273E1B01|nr:hypothetical protein [Oceaniradius stylonematis]